MTTGRINQVARDARDTLRTHAHKRRTHAERRIRPAFDTRHAPTTAHTPTARNAPPMREKRRRRDRANSPEVQSTDLRAQRRGHRKQIHRTHLGRCALTANPARRGPRGPPLPSGTSSNHSNERSPMLSDGSASRPQTRTRTDRAAKERQHTAHVRDSTSAAEAPPNTGSAADASNPTSRREEPNAPRRLVRRTKWKRCPEGNHSVLNPTRERTHDPNRGTPPTLAVSGAPKRPQPHGVAACSNEHRGPPPAAPARTALSTLGRLHTTRSQIERHAEAKPPR